MTATAGVTADEASALAGGRVLRTYEGLGPTQVILDAVRDRRAAGVTIFRADNVGSPADLRAACETLQAARPADDPPLVIGLDQEGGQLQAVGHGATAWPGAMALGATGSTELATAAGAAIGAEAAALGATLVYAPVCDVIARASATPLGTRSFGSDPISVAALAGAFTAGLQSAGVAATLKHFPGHGSAAADSHAGLPVVDGPAERIRERGLPPFRAGIAAGALVVMPGHLAVPGLTDGRIEAATVSRTILVDLLRGELGFDGVALSDALDMGGAGDPDRLDETVVMAAEAGIDLLLLNHEASAEEAVVAALTRAILSGRHGVVAARTAAERVSALRRRLDLGSTPALEVVGGPEHLALARRIAEASITLVRDDRRTLPLAVPDGGRIALLAPVPVDLTPAETSSYVRLGLAGALRDRGLQVSELVVPLDPTSAEVAALAFAAGDADATILGTYDAVSHPGQAALAQALAGRPSTVAVALRSPYDAELLPPELALVCTYGIQAPQMEALADALLGWLPFHGSLPIALGAAATSLAEAGRTR
jgi:beta-N-acetylhexosaminidase